LANRSAQLVQLAARLLCQRCENILVTDMVWPAYLAILSAECRRAGRTIATVPIRQAIFRDRISKQELIRHIVSHYHAQDCTGLFVSAVTFDGVRLPVREVCQRIRDSGRRPRFVVVDSAQALNHTPLGLYHNYCDFLIAGSHKWLRAYHPMGFGFCCRHQSNDFIVRRCRQMLARRVLDDPLLRFTQQLESDNLEAFSETVNVAPMFTATAAAAHALYSDACRADELAAQLVNADRFAERTSDCGWRLLRPEAALRTGILLLEAKSPDTRNASVDHLRNAFRRTGVALTAYAGGIIRTSFLQRPLPSSHIHSVREALRQCA
jgi:selenocysteine lyase/cysteine desulfurase